MQFQTAFLSQLLTCPSSQNPQRILPSNPQPILQRSQSPASSIAFDRPEEKTVSLGYFNKAIHQQISASVGKGQTDTKTVTENRSQKGSGTAKEGLKGREG